MKMAKKKNREFWESATMNNLNFKYYYNRLTELAISMFEWKNLPSTVDPRFLELTLFTDGQAVFFKDETLGYLALQNMVNGGFNVYRIPKNRRAFAVNGYNKELNEKDSVIIYNNYLHTNSAPEIEMFAKRLWDLDRTIDVNAKAQKTPVAIICDEDERLAMMNLYKAYEGNEPFIFGCKGMNTKGVTSLSTGAPYVADKIYTLKTQIWNEALTYLGISNLNIQKKERLVSDEVTRNMGGVIASRYSRLEARREACKMINELFGFTGDNAIECNYREDFREADDEVMFSGSTGDGVATAQVFDIRTK